MKRIKQIILFSTTSILIFCYITYLISFFYVGFTSAPKYNSLGSSIQYCKAENSEDGNAYIIAPQNRNLKILVLSDPQIDPTNKYHKIGSNNEKTFDFIDSLIVNSKPDLVIITGDLVMSVELNQWQYMQRYAEIFENRKTLWTFIFGNHDSQYEYVSQISNTFSLLGQMPKRKIAQAMSEYKHCLFPKNFEINNGFFVNIKDYKGNLIRCISLFDCVNNKFEDEDFYYRELTPNQLNWYKNEVSQIAYNNSILVDDIKTTVMLHIPLAEFFYAGLQYYTNNIQDITYHYGDIVKTNINIKTKWHSYRDLIYENNVFDKIRLLKNIDSIYFGHFHDNDLSITYKGIRLTSVQHSGFGHTYRVNYPNGLKENYVDFSNVLTYGDNRGGTMIEIDYNGEISQYQVLGKNIIKDYASKFAINYNAIIENLKSLNYNLKLS